MEQALLSSEARYREVVENSLGFVFTCSMEGRLTSLNAFTAETLGYRAEALMGRMVTELMDAAGAAAFQDCLNTLESAGRLAGRVAAAAQRRRLPAHCGAQPAHATARRTALRADPRHGCDRAARSRGGAAPGHAAARADSGIGGRRYLRHRPRRQADLHQRSRRAGAGLHAGAAGGARHARDHPPQPRRRDAVFQVDQPDSAGAAAVRVDPHAGRGLLAQGRDGDSRGVQRQSAAWRTAASRAWWWRSRT